MRVCIIGRTEMLYETAKLLLQNGYQIPVIITAREAPEYLVKTSDFENLAKELDAKFFVCNRFNDNTIINEIKSSGCDIAISVNFPTLISQEIIDAFPLGILNAHGGDLPRYKGNACQSWAIINGENKIGLCVYKIQGDILDAGKIISRNYFPVTIKTTITEVWNWMRHEVPGMFLNSIKLLQTNPGYFIEDSGNSTITPLRCYPRTPADGKINWSVSNMDIVRLINASTRPYPGAFCYLDGTKITIWEAEPVDSAENFLAIPGQVSKICDNGEVEVIAGTGKILVKKIGVDNLEMIPGQIIKSVRCRLM